MGKLIITVLLCVTVSGCSKPDSLTKTSEHTGDLGAFILDSVVDHGGQPKNTYNLPNLKGQWRAAVSVDNPESTERDYLKEWETIKIWTTGFQQVTGYLVAAFGSPVLQTSNGVTAGFYIQKDIGLSLMFCQDTRNTNDIIVSWWGKKK